MTFRPVLPDDEPHKMMAFPRCGSSPSGGVGIERLAERQLAQRSSDFKYAITSAT